MESPLEEDIVARSGLRMIVCRKIMRRLGLTRPPGGFCRMEILKEFLVRMGLGFMLVRSLRYMKICFSKLLRLFLRLILYEM
jgi:hypothetical protein